MPVRCRLNRYARKWFSDIDKAEMEIAGDRFKSAGASVDGALRGLAGALSAHLAAINDLETMESNKNLLLTTQIAKIAEVVRRVRAIDILCGAIANIPGLPFYLNTAGHLSQDQIKSLEKVASEFADSFLRRR